MSLQESIKQQLNLQYLQPARKSAKGGCISQTSIFDSDVGCLFVKYNKDARIAKIMFDGEVESLQAIAATGTIMVPRPFAVVSDDETCCFVAEYRDLRPLRNYEGVLGQQLAKLHLENMKREPIKRITKFGFHVSTCCGRIPLDNSWNNDWLDFYSRQRVDPQVGMILKSEKNEELKSLWSILKAKLPRYFEGTKVFPSLLHGDLWSGNGAETKGGPIIFDPASFYGHHEFDLAIAKMFGGFGRHFYEEYHRIIPKEEGFEVRLSLYQLFHYLNHWNHFGASYRKGAISAMEKLLAIN